MFLYWDSIKSTPNRNKKCKSLRNFIKWLKPLNNKKAFEETEEIHAWREHKLSDKELAKKFAVDLEKGLHQSQAD